MNTLTYLSSEAFSSIPRDLVSDLQRMLSSNEALRPTAMDFTGKDVILSSHTYALVILYEMNIWEVAF